MHHFCHAWVGLYPLQKVAVIVWIALIAGIGGRVAFGPQRSQSVVPIYLTAAERWTQGDDVYVVDPHLDVYRYPPTVTPAFVPLTWLQERFAELAWRGLSVAVFLIAFRGWVRDGLPRTLKPAEIGVMFVLAALPVLPSLNNGQINVLLAGLLLLGATAAAQTRFWQAGLWLAVATVIKVYPVAAALLIGLERPRRILPMLVLSCIALGSVPLLFRNTDVVTTEYRNFIHFVRTDDRTDSEPKRQPRDFRLLLRVWADTPSPGVYLGLQFGVAAAMAGLVILAGRRTRDPRIVAPLGLHLGCVWMTVFGPATETHTYTLLGPTASIAVVLSSQSRLRFSLAFAGYVLLISTTLRDMFPNGVAYQLLAPQPLGALLILTVVVWEAIRSCHAHNSAMWRSAATLGQPYESHRSTGQAA